MGLFETDETLKAALASTGSFFSYANNLKTPKNFAKYKAKIEDTKKYINSKKKAFYSNTTLKEK